MADTNELPRILCVDDEPRILRGLEKVTFEHFQLTTRESGEEGLKAIEDEGPFSVIVSDMKMPGMDGATFLEKACKMAPTTVRVLLTGQADVNAAIAAVNKGKLFRFLCKPIQTEDMLLALYDSVDQHQLLKGEKELLEETLNGTVKMLVNILDLAAPMAFSRALQIKKYVIYMATNQECGVKWQFTLSAMLSHIGAITLPPDTLSRYYAGQEISKEERQMLDEIPATGFNLLKKIPRLRSVAKIIQQQREPFNSDAADNLIASGAMMLKTAVDIDKLVSGKSSFPDAVNKLKKSEGEYDPNLLDIMKHYQQIGYNEVLKAVNVNQLTTVMTLDEDVLTSDGNVVVGKGRRIDALMLERLQNFARGVGIQEPIRVMVMS